MFKMKKTILVCCIALMTLAGLYAKDGAAASSKEGQADTALLIIDKDGILTGVTDKTKLTGKLVLPAEVKRIGYEAFSGCKGLTSVDFSACKNLSEIGDWVFVTCTGLTSMDFSACTKLTEIGDAAFAGCTGLTEVRLPANLNKVNGSAFTNCDSLHTLTVDPANKTYCSKDNVLYTKDMKTFVCATRYITRISIPDTVTAIGKGAFASRTDLSEVRLPAGLTEIDAGAFKGCTGLTNVDISACTNLTQIGWFAFEGCTGLSEISFPARLTEIGYKAFKDCTGLTNVDLSACTGLTEIREWTFKGCSGLTSVDLSVCTKLSKIGGSAFADCTGLAEICLPASLTKLDGSVFSNCSSLHTLTVAPANQVYCSKDNIIYTKDMKTLICAKRNITHISIRDTVTKIDKYAFSGGIGIRETRFPARCTEIGEGAFFNCTGLMSVDLSACTGLTQIGAGAFAGCTSLTEVCFPVGLTEIGWASFGNCTSLAEIRFPAALTKIAQETFFGCKGLTEVRFPVALTEIGKKAFSDCTGLTEIDFSACTTLTRIGRDAFRNIASTVRFNIPNESVIRLLTESGLNLKKQ